MSASRNPPLSLGTEAVDRSVTIGGKALDGLLRVPSAPKELVIFAHGSGMGRFSPRNTYVAQHLRLCGLPRGGVPVAAEVARALDAPLDLVMVRKIGVSYQPELATAAVVDGPDPQIVVNEEVQSVAGVSRDYIDKQAEFELTENERRRKLYLRGRQSARIEGRSAIVVDDGIAGTRPTQRVVRGLRYGLCLRKPCVDADQHIPCKSGEA